jgi:putative endonuclease
MNGKKRGFVYILMNKNRTVIYTGVTADLFSRIAAHKSKKVDGFTKRYNVTQLVYFEEFDSIEQAIENEKRIKAGSRAKKWH